MSSIQSENDDEKSHSFRKRRLSLSKHHLFASTSCQEAGPPSLPSDQQPSPPSPSSDEKAHTFRKRRLSLTKLKQQQHDATSEEEEEEEDQPVAQRPRRASEWSIGTSTSIASSNASGNNLLYPSKTLHAGELVGQHAQTPPSPAVHSDNVLYSHKPLVRTPSPQPLPPAAAAAAAAMTDGASSSSFAVTPSAAAPQQPKWKKRYVFSLSEQHKLPFPRDIVGTYSCHGIEPIYDSEYEEQDEGWLEADDCQEEQDEQQQQQEEEYATAVAVPDANDQQLPPDTSQKKESPDENLDNEHQQQQQQQTESSHTDMTASSPGLNTAAVLNNNNNNKTIAKINQDRGGVAFPYGNCPKTALFHVYDGHGQGGELVSQFALYKIQRLLEKHPSFPDDLDTALKETFINVDEALKREPLIEPFFAGTTACVALLKGQSLTIANVGDSRAVMARRHSSSSSSSDDESGSKDKKDDEAACSWQAVPLTEDQNPDVPTEMNRIISLGGYVTPPPAPGLSARVWLDAACTQIGLAMSRSLGDHAVSDIGVVSEPVISKYEIDARYDDFMILASDGVWEFLDSAQAVEIVGQNLDRGATKACQALIETAAAKWHEEEGEYRDDITAIVIRLQELWRDRAVGKGE